MFWYPVRILIFNFRRQWRRRSRPFFSKSGSTMEVCPIQSQPDGVPSQQGDSNHVGVWTFKYARQLFDEMPTIRGMPLSPQETDAHRGMKGVGSWACFQGWVFGECSSGEFTCHLWMYSCMHGKCKVLGGARRVFDEIENPDHVPLNVIIKGALIVVRGRRRFAS